MAKKVAVIFGSRSTEHDVSIITALVGVLGPIKLLADYDAVPVYIAKDGSWYSEETLGDINFYTSGDVDQKLKKFKKVHLLFDDGLWLVKDGLKRKKIKIDVAFPATHGTYGEDGSLMGLLRLAGVPFVGADLIESAISMDKLAAKRIVREAGIPTPDFVGFSAREYMTDKSSIEANIAKLGFPLFVKPTHLGSSIAVTRVSEQKDLVNAIEVALHYDSAAIVEKAVQNLVEVTVPVIGNENYDVGMVEEYLYKPGEFFDFESKYMHGGKKGGKKSGSGQGGGNYSRMPADLPRELYQAAENTAKDVWRAVGGSGYARIDLLIDSKSKLVYFNEINPMPGSLQAHNWREAGVSGSDLVKKLITLAEERFEQHHSKETVFSSNFLKQF